MSEKLVTTGQLREFLASMMQAVKSGEVEITQAAQITKLAGQINESFYAEVKIAKVRAEANKEMSELGALRIGE